MLRYLWEEAGAPKLDTYVARSSTPRPRSVIATRDEIETLKNHAPDDLRLFILLCADLAIRSGTAVKISPAEVRRRRATPPLLHKERRARRPARHRGIAELFDRLRRHNPEPFIRKFANASARTACTG